MRGVLRAEDWGGRWMMAVAEFCGGEANVGRMAVQLAFEKVH